MGQAWTDTGLENRCRRVYEALGVLEEPERVNSCS